MGLSSINSVLRYSLVPFKYTERWGINVFKIVYRRYTNFSMESIEQTFSGGNVDFGRRVTATVSRNGDLIHKTYLQLLLPALNSSGGNVAWTRNIGNVLIREVEIEIGGQRIDRHYGQFLHIWQELTLTKELEDTYNVMIGNTTELTTPAASIPARTLYIPFMFWFNRNVGLSLPLIALQYHEVKFNIEFRPFDQCVIAETIANVAPAALTASSLWIDYIYLDTDERRQFAQIAHEYLVEQLQFTGAESFSQLNIRQRLNFNHPCKELIWVAQLDSNGDDGSNRWTDFTDSGTTSGKEYIGNDMVIDAKLLLNGHDRFATRQGSYFNLVQPYQHHTRGPSTGIYVYSFAVKPEDHQPSGTINMSRIDNATLQMTLISPAAMKLYTYMTNYNVLRIMSGMAGLAYSN
jgi:hypothetical protein